MNWQPTTKIEILLYHRFQSKGAVAEFLGVTRPTLNRMLEDERRLLFYADVLAPECKVQFCDFCNQVNTNAVKHFKNGVSLTERG